MNAIKLFQDEKIRVKWVDEEINNVADYLNKNFYKF